MAQQCCKIRQRLDVKPTTTWYRRCHYVHSAAAPPPYLPALVEPSILQVDDGSPDKLVAPDVVIVHHVDLINPSRHRDTEHERYKGTVQYRIRYSSTEGDMRLIARRPTRVIKRTKTAVRLVGRNTCTEKSELNVTQTVCFSLGYTKKQTELIGTTIRSREWTRRLWYDVRYPSIYYNRKAAQGSYLPREEKNYINDEQPHGQL